MEVCGKPTCSCPAFKFSGKKQTCKHITIHLGEKVFKTKAKYKSPEQKRAEQVIAGREGRAAADKLKTHPSYNSVSDKVAGDKDLAEFMDKIK